MISIRDTLDIILTMGGLATGAVVSLLSAILLFLSELLALDHITLALAWVMVAAVFAIGYMTARKQMHQAMKKVDLLGDF